MLVAVHEIGHLLGVVHDGDYAPSYLPGPGAASCSWYDGYIMSDRRRDYRGHQWSSCSLQQLRYFLSSWRADCLINYPSSSMISLPGTRSLAGYGISLDTQCYQDMGTRACFHDSRVCSQLFCYSSSYTSCVSYRPAVEGSSCGSQSVCRDGLCVSQYYSSSSSSSSSGFTTTTTSRFTNGF